MDEWTIRGMHEEEGGCKWIFWLSAHTFNEYMHEGMEWKKWHDGMSVWRYEWYSWWTFDWICETSWCICISIGFETSLV